MALIEANYAVAELRTLVKPPGATSFGPRKGQPRLAKPGRSKRL